LSFTEIIRSIRGFVEELVSLVEYVFSYGQVFVILQPVERHYHAVWEDELTIL
jgi:hypothetical protein